MPRRHTADEIAHKLERANALHASGQTVASLSRELGVASGTYLRWRRHFGGLDGAQIRHVRKLEQENLQLRRRLAQLNACSPHLVFG
ncbi:MAG: transposase [Hyphomonadaceae bacterium]